MRHLSLSWSTELEAWTGWLRAAGRPESTIGLRTYHVRRFAGDHGELGPWQVELDELVTWMAGHQWAAETRRAYRASLRSFYGWGQAVGRRPDSPAALLPTITPPRGQPRPVPEIIYRTALLAAAPRERLMIRLAAQCGLRRGEIARVRGGDVSVDLYGHSLRVIGKGQHVRMVPLPDDLAADLLRHRSGYVFSSREGGHLTAHHVGKLVSAVLPRGWTCHTLRHRCASVAYGQTHDLRAVQTLLGHAKPETTARYTAVPDGGVRAAMNAAAS